jgi:hypothetical protein
MLIQSLEFILISKKGTTGGKPVKQPPFCFSVVSGICRHNHSDKNDIQAYNLEKSLYKP